MTTHRQFLQCILIVLLSLLAFEKKAQQPLYKNISINDGLPTSSTYFVLNDKKGYIWIATDLGVSKFDGKKFAHFGSEQGLSQSTIIYLTEDNEGVIWIASNTGKVFYIKNDKVFSSPFSNQFYLELKNVGGTITGLKFDEADTLWIPTSRHLYKVPKQNNYYKFYRDGSFNDSALCVLKTFKNNNSIASQYSSRQKKLQIKGDTGRAFIQIQNQGSKTNILEISFSVREGVNPRTVSMKSLKGATYITYLNKLYAFDKGNFRLVESYPSTILFLFEDREGHIYVSLSNGNGVKMYDNGDFTKNPLNIFIGSSVGSICQDFENGIWFSSTNKGVFYIPYLRSYQYLNHPSLCDRVKDMIQTDSLLIVVNSKNDLCIINRKENITYQKGMAEFHSRDKISSLYAGSQIYYCSPVVFEMNLKTYVKRKHSLNGIPLAANGIVKTKNNKLYGIINYNFCEINDTIWKIIHPLQNRSICIFYSDEFDEIWIGSTSGILKYTSKGFEPVEPLLFNSQTITFIGKSLTGAIYVCTKGKGLFILKNKKWTHLNEQNGLSSNFCQHVQVDNDTIVWVSTNKGVSYFKETKTDVINNFNKNNGLNTNEVFYTSVFNGNLFVGGGEGLLKIDLKETKAKFLNYPIYFKKQLLGYSETTNNQFPYSQGSIRFVIDCITYKQLFHQQYFYQLKGFDDSVKVTSNDYIEFSNLSPGNYELWLGTTDHFGKLQQLKKYYAFEILLPYWQKWWFYLLIVVLICCITFLIIKWRLRAKEKENNEKREIDKLISESQITAVRAQMNPHFIFNCINSIQDFVLNNQTHEAYNYLAKFAKLIRLALINSKNNYITLEKEIEWLSLYIELEQLRFKNQFDFILKIDPDIRSSTDIKLPNMLIQPFIENAIWHGLMSLPVEQKGELLLYIELNHSALKVVVQDNGVGREHSQSLKHQNIHESMGLKLINDKLNALEKIDNLKLNYKITDLFKDGKPSGTKVEITIEI